VKLLAYSLPLSAISTLTLTEKAGKTLPLETSRMIGYMTI